MNIPRERCLSIRIAERIREDPQAAKALGVEMKEKIILRRIRTMSKCPRCGNQLLEDREPDGSWDGESYYCEYCSSVSCNEEGEYLSVDEAAQIWLSSGKDEDQMFGYTEEELEAAL